MTQFTPNFTLGRHRRSIGRDQFRTKLRPTDILWECLKYGALVFVEVSLPDHSYAADELDTPSVTSDSLEGINWV